jgi:hypothetical protein
MVNKPMPDKAEDIEVSKCSIASLVDLQAPVVPGLKANCQRRELEQIT